MSLARSAGIAAIGLLLICSCKDNGLKLNPVRGQLFFQGAPAEGALVVFQRQGATGASDPKPSGKVGNDGSFTLTTYQHGEGAPAGDYVVLVTWFPPNARELENATNKLPARFASADSTTLKATVKDGTNELEPFRLTK